MNFICFLPFFVALAHATVRRPLLIVSLDGMRADKFDEFVRENPTSNFSKIINNGLKAEYMTPVFPSLTFPNHFTLVTGDKKQQNIFFGIYLHLYFYKRCLFRRAWLVSL